MNNQWDDDESSGLHTAQGHDPDLLPESATWGLILLMVAAVGFLLWLFWSRRQ